jgi:hypothetical protein
MSTLILTSKDLKRPKQKPSLTNIKNCFTHERGDDFILIEDISTIIYREGNKDIILQSPLTNLKDTD